MWANILQIGIVHSSTQNYQGRVTLLSLPIYEPRNTEGERSSGPGWLHEALAPLRAGTDHTLLHLIQLPFNFSDQWENRDHLTIYLNGQLVKQIIPE